MMRTIILFGHGARDPRWADPMRAIAKEMQRLDPDATVELAFLEFMTPNLPDLARMLAERGLSQARLVPVFLGGAGHVLRDLPALVEQCLVNYPALKIEVVDSVGQHPEVVQMIARVALGTGH
jgi:sirohydrochlorin cobaltochelatase